MGPLFSYAISSAIYLLAGYLTYKIFLSGACQHKLNRVMLYLITVLSLILPFCSKSMLHQVFQTKSVVNTSSDMIGLELIPGGIVEETPISYWPAIATSVYLVGMLLTALWLLSGIISTMRIIRHGEHMTVCINGHKSKLTIVDDEKTAPFSWFGNIVINRSDYAGDSRTILLHETGHIRHRHSFDLSGFMPLLLLQWFNPAAWLIVEELRTVHEYQADEEVIISGADIRQYQMMLIRKAVGTRFPSPANSLNHSNLKNRITMMYKKRSGNGRKAALLMALPAMAVAMCVTDIPAIASILADVSEVSFLPESKCKISKISSNDEMSAPEPATDRNSGAVKILADDSNSSEDVTDTDATEVKHLDEAIPAEDIKKEGEIPEEKITTAPQQLAEYPGGMEALKKFLIENIRYPEAAVSSKAEGRVIVRFVVGKDGKVRDAKIMKGVTGELDEEAVRLVESMPDWQPAVDDGKPVSSHFTLPISFKLPKDE